MTKKEYIGAFLDGYFAENKIEYGISYFSILANAEELAERKFNEYKKQLKKLKK